MTPNVNPISPYRWLALVGVVLAVTVLSPLLSSLKKDAAPSSPPAIQLPPKPEEIAEPHLLSAEQAADRAIEEHIKSINAFFEDAKQGTRPFAADALGWSSKWKMVADCVPFTSGERHSQYLREQFQKHIFSEAQLVDNMEKVVQNYIQSIQSIESKMLVDLQSDTAEFAETYPISQLDEAMLKEKFDEALARSIAAAGNDIRADVAKETVSIIAASILTQVAVRLGVSAGILSAGAASGWATFGIGVVAGLIVDQIVSWTWDWWADPRGSLAADIDLKLSEINDLIVNGAPGVEGLRARLGRHARERAVLRREAVLSLLKSPQGVRQ